MKLLTWIGIHLSLVHGMYLSDPSFESGILNVTGKIQDLLFDLDLSLDRHVRMFLDQTKDFIRFFHPTKAKLLSQHLSLYARNLTIVQVLLTGVRVRIERQVETDRVFALLELILREWLFARPLIWRDSQSGLSLQSYLNCEHLRMKDVSTWLQMIAGHLIRFHRHFDEKLHAHRQAKQQAIMCWKLVQIMIAVDKLYGHQSLVEKEVFEREMLLSSMASGAMILLRHTPKFDISPEAVVYEMCLAVEQIAIFLYNQQMPKSDLAIEVIVLNAHKINMPDHSELVKQIAEYRRSKIKARNDMEMERRAQLENSLLALEKETVQQQKPVYSEYNISLSESEDEEEDAEQIEMPDDIPKQLPDVPLLYRTFALIQWAQECRKRVLTPIRKKVYPKEKPANWSWEQVLEMAGDHEAQVCLGIVKKRNDLVHGTDIIRLISNPKDVNLGKSQMALLAMHPNPNPNDESLRPFEIQGLPSLPLIREQMIWVALGSLCELLPTGHNMSACHDLASKRNEAAHPKLMNDKAMLKQLWNLL